MFKNMTALQVSFVTVVALFAIVAVVGFGLMLFVEGYTQSPTYVPSLYDLLA